MSGPFHPDELAGSAEPIGSSADAARLLELARDLEGIARPGPAPTAGFEARVLAALALEPLPRPTGAAGLAARQGRPLAMLLALRDTWRIAWRGGGPPAVRAQAAAFVLVVVLLAGSLGGLATVGGFRLLGPGPTVGGPSTVSTGGPGASTTSSMGPSVSGSPEPSESLEPSGSPDASEAGETPGPGRTQRPSGTPPPGGGSGSGGSGTATAVPTATPTPTPTFDDRGTPRPGDTPRPSGTPRPTEAPDATSDPGHG
ncbi:MAG: hypothetical protein IVW53_00655 [Chloroflexi bacterium]|nr:hypothetical protein [Chloroflexota bacterium]